MTDKIRAAVMTLGHCSFCGGPAERGLSGRWWHLTQSCGHGPNGGFVAVPAGAIPKGPLGWKAKWPARFVAGDPPEIEDIPDDDTGQLEESRDEEGKAS